MYDRLLLDLNVCSLISLAWRHCVSLKLQLTFFAAGTRHDAIMHLLR